MTRHILITGGTGFIGRPLCKALTGRGDSVTVHSRQPGGRVKELCGDEVETIGRLSELATVAPINAVINLAGAGIAEKRWTSARKRQIVDSRVALTEELIKTLASSYHQPDVIVSGSAVGYYGDQGDSVVTEATPPNREFTHELCAVWEKAAIKARDLDTRVVLSRTGLVMGRDGGFMARMLPPFKLGVGGRLGNGKQYMPWIHRRDMVRGLLFLLDSPTAKGAYNLVSPNPVTNAEFTRTLGDVLGKPTVLPLPGPLLKVALGEMARLLLTGQKAVPHRLQQDGFVFEYEHLRPALEEVLARRAVS